GGGTGPATNLTRHEVQRPRPPHVAVMSTPASCAARRMVRPGSTRSVSWSGRMVSGTVMRAPGYHFPLDLLRAFGGIVAKILHVGPGGCRPRIRLLPRDLAGPAPARNGARALSGHARAPGEPPRSGRGRR